MNTNTPAHPAPVAVQELDLMPYLDGLIDRRWWLLLAFLTGAALAGWYAWDRPYMFQATARVSIIDIEDPGGVSPDDRRASEVLTLVEHGFVMGTTQDNYNAVMRARLTSRAFITRFLDAHNVYRHFYPDYWLEEESRWVDGFTPDRGESIARFRDEVRTIDTDEETDIISVSMTWHDPHVARDWANQYVADFNRFMRERTMADVERKQAYLRNMLRESDVLDMQQSIYRLIEAQTAIAMLASAREEYAMEIIDPAATPLRSFTLSRKKTIVIGAIAGLCLGIFGIFASVLLARLLQVIKQHRANGADTDESTTEIQQ